MLHKKWIPRSRVFGKIYKPDSLVQTCNGQQYIKNRGFMGEGTLLKSAFLKLARVY